MEWSVRHIRVRSTSFFNETFKSEVFRIELTIKVLVFHKALAVQGKSKSAQVS